MKAKISPPIRKKIPDASQFFEGIQQGNLSMLSRAITLCESSQPNHKPTAAELINLCLPLSGKSVRIGITGVPGVGKSTFIEQLGLFYLQKGSKVAVLAIDPSSPVSKGSILGDKTRMEKLSAHPDAFIRPTSAGESLGGVAKNTREAMVLCEVAGFDVILIETVGVGQSETFVHSLCDFFLLLYLAGSGDGLQGIKRGIMEMADAIAVNKADGNNLKAARLAKAELENALHIWPPKEGNWSPPVLLCSALTNEGISEIGVLISERISENKKSGRFQKHRDEQQQFWFKQSLEEMLKTNFYACPEVKEALENLKNKGNNNTFNPFEAAEKLMRVYQSSLKK